MKLLARVVVIGLFLIGCGNPTQPDETIRSCVTCTSDHAYVAVVPKDIVQEMENLRESFNTKSRIYGFTYHLLEYGDNICMDHSTKDTLIFLVEYN